ncbi:MAG TPA: ATP-binding protein [Candidatus Xenobia bacterium]
MTDLPTTGFEVMHGGLPPLTPGGVVAIRVPCMPDYFRVCRLLISGIAQRLHLPWDLVEDLKLAVSEGCNLVCGNTISVDASVNLRIEVKAETLDMSLDGPPGGARTDAVADGEEMDMSSMGLFFIQSLMDEAQYSVGRDQAAHLVMVKNLNDDEDQEDGDGG